MTAATETAKVKKASAPKKPRAHPPYVEMVKDAIVALKERTGSSQHAIGKYIEVKQKDLPPNFKKLLLVQLKKLVATGKLTKVKNSFKLPAAEKSKPKPKPVATKKAPEKKGPVKKAPAKAKKVATPVKTKKVAAKPKAVVKKPRKVAKAATVTTPGKKKAVVKKKTPAVAKLKKTPAVAKVKKTPVKKVAKKPKSIKSPAKKVAAKKAKK